VAPCLDDTHQLAHGEMPELLQILFDAGKRRPIVRAFGQIVETDHTHIVRHREPIQGGDAQNAESHLIVGRKYGVHFRVLLPQAPVRHLAARGRPVSLR